MLHVQVLLRASLCSGDVAQPRTDQHQGRVAIGKTLYYISTAADFPVQSFYDVVHANTQLVLAVEVDFLHIYYIKVLKRISFGLQMYSRFKNPILYIA